jgi:hypothetical protein
MTKLIFTLTLAAFALLANDDHKPIAVTPEPATWIMMGGALIIGGLVQHVRRKK